MQLWTAHFRYSHVEEDTARPLSLASDPVISPKIGRDLVTGVFQATFHRRPEGRIVIDNMHASLHRLLPAEEALGYRRIELLATPIICRVASPKWVRCKDRKTYFRRAALVTRFAGSSVGRDPQDVRLGFRA